MNLYNEVLRCNSEAFDHISPDIKKRCWFYITTNHIRGTREADIRQIKKFEAGHHHHRPLAVTARRHRYSSMIQESHFRIYVGRFHSLMLGRLNLMLGIFLSQHITNTYQNQHVVSIHLPPCTQLDGINKTGLLEPSFSIAYTKKTQIVNSIRTFNNKNLLKRNVKRSIDGLKV